MARRAPSLNDTTPSRHLAAPSSMQRADTPEQREADRLRWSARWRAVRQIVLAREPMCRACAAEGRERLAVEVDHIEPLVVSVRAGRPLMAFTESNLQPLCEPCHDTKSARERQAGA